MLVINTKDFGQLCEEQIKKNKANKQILTDRYEKAANITHIVIGIAIPIICMVLLYFLASPVAFTYESGVGDFMYKVKDVSKIDTLCAIAGCTLSTITVFIYSLSKNTYKKITALSGKRIGQVQKDTNADALESKEETEEDLENAILEERAKKANIQFRHILLSTIMYDAFLILLVVVNHYIY